MEQHERERPMTEAKLAISERVTACIDQYDLTYGEIWMILSEIAASWAKMNIRDERKK